MALENLTSFLTSFNSFPVWAILVITVWSLIWKGIALWKSARKNSPIWFVVLLIVNTIGILEILYIFIFSKIKPKSSQGKVFRKKKR